MAPDSRTDDISPPPRSAHVRRALSVTVVERSGGMCGGPGFRMVPSAAPPLGLPRTERSRTGEMPSSGLGPPSGMGGEGGVDEGARAGVRSGRGPAGRRLDVAGERRTSPRLEHSTSHPRSRRQLLRGKGRRDGRFLPCLRKDIV
eukprot:scaffold110367_cov22-Tisochrysis_lutea.AAC.2